MRSGASRSIRRQQQSGTSNNDFGKECTEVFGIGEGLMEEERKKRCRSYSNGEGAKKIIWDLANLHSGCKENKTDAVHSLAVR